MSTQKFIKVYSNIICNSRKMETTQVSINGQMGKKKNMVYSYNESMGCYSAIKRNIVLFIHKKEYSVNTCYNIDEPWKHYMCERRQSLSLSLSNTHTYILYDFIHMNVQNREIYKNRKQISDCQSQGRGIWDMGVIAKGYGVSF